MAFKLYTYALQNDTGFAPCYENGEYTLACCKPNLRADLFNSQEKDDVWIVGYWRIKGDEVYLVYVAKIEQVLALENYYDSGIYGTRSDCIYDNVKSLCTEKKNVRKATKIETLYPDYIQHENQYHNRSNIRTDLYGNCVLYSKTFAHFPRLAVSVPDILMPLTRDNRDFRSFPKKENGEADTVRQELEALLLSDKQEIIIRPWGNKKKTR